MPVAKERSTKPKKEVKKPKKTPPKAAPKKVNSVNSLESIRYAAVLFKQVSDPTRLRLLMLLAERERNVTQLCADLGVTSQPAVSHHLALLRHGRIVEPRRQGKNNFYNLTKMGRLITNAAVAVVANAA
jgi:ArsR family transcriptional regulator, zinc-responsive transcriptional repressor